jgi:hypothetical protein
MIRILTSVGIGLVILGLVGWIDYVTGYEVSVVPLYALPIAWVTWRLNMGWGLAFAFLGAGLWICVELASGYQYTHRWHAWENAAMELIIMAFVAVSLSFFKRILGRERERVRHLEGALPVCAVCKRIEDTNGYWMEIEAYLREHTASTPQHKLCPDCARAQYLSGYTKV